MGEESEKNDPPPPSLSKPSSPPPPSLTPPTPAPPMPEKKNPSGPPPTVNSGVDVGTVPTDDEEDEFENGATAPLNSRLLAGVIDVIVAASLAGSVLMLLPEFLSKLSVILWGAYWVTRDSLPFLKGQSIGKMAMKLKVEKLDGTPMIDDWPTALVRNAALLIPPFQLVEAIVLISRDGKQESGRRLGDEWAKTKVVVFREEEEASEAS